MAATISLGWAATASAACAPQAGDPFAAAADADAAFVGVARPGPGDAVGLFSPAVFIVERSLKGHGKRGDAERVATSHTTPDADGVSASNGEGISPTPRERWLIFGRRRSSGTLATSLCAGSHRLDAMPQTQRVTFGGHVVIARAADWQGRTVDASLPSVHAVGPQRIDGRRLLAVRVRRHGQSIIPAHHRGRWSTRLRPGDRVVLGAEDGFFAVRIQ